MTLFIQEIADDTGTVSKQMLTTYSDAARAKRVADRLYEFAAYGVQIVDDAGRVVWCQTPSTVYLDLPSVVDLGPDDRTENAVLRQPN